MQWRPIRPVRRDMIAIKEQVGLEVDKMNMKYAIKNCYYGD